MDVATKAATCLPGSVRPQVEALLQDPAFYHAAVGLHPPRDGFQCGVAGDRQKPIFVLCMRRVRLCANG
jgi:hypothetical protein